MDPHSKLPWLPWHQRIMRERHYLEYWLQGQAHSQWVCRWREISDLCLEFEDYVTQRVTTIKSDVPVVYRVTKYQ